MAKALSSTPAVLAAAPLRPATTDSASVMVFALIVSFFVPIQIFIGDIRLSPYRIVLLIGFLTVLPRLANPQTGFRLRLPDFLLLAAGLVGAVSLIVHGAAIQTIGIFLIETYGAYFIARAYLTGKRSFAAMARVFSGAVIATLPFAVYEGVTGDPILIQLLDTVFTVLPNVPHETRLGLDRAQLTLDHPILYGVFSAMAFSLAFYACHAQSTARESWLRAGGVLAAVFFSLSSGAFVAAGLQVCLIAYDKLFAFLKAQWKMLVWGTAAAYAVIEGLSNRSVPKIAIDFIALNPHNAWTRINVNQWAWEAIMAHPLFGLAPGANWPRPFWVGTASIDNFYIAMAFKQGLPVVALLLASIAVSLYMVGRVRSTDPGFNACRKAFAITIIGVCIAVYTVHMWNATYCMFLFLLGSGGWMWRAQTETADVDDMPHPLRDRMTERPRSGGDLPYSRFAGDAATPFSREGQYVATNAQDGQSGTAIKRPAHTRETVARFSRHEDGET